MSTLLKRKRFILLLNLYFLLFLCPKTESKCRKGCPLAMASYFVLQGSNLTYISKLFSQKIPEILQYNRNVPNPSAIRSKTRISVPISCDCINGDFLGHTFLYKTEVGDTYQKVATIVFANLTTDYWLERVNIYDPTRIPYGATINVTVNCSCGDRRVSRDYGLFVTHPLREGEDLAALVAESGVPGKLLERFNSGLNFGAGSGLVFLPARGVDLIGSRDGQVPTPKFLKILISNDIIIKCNHS